jgi:hypothetical protein
MLAPTPIPPDEFGCAAAGAATAIGITDIARVSSTFRTGILHVSGWSVPIAGDWNYGKWRAKSILLRLCATLRPTPASVVKNAVLVVGLIAISAGLRAQEQSAIYLFAVDGTGTPLLDLKTSDITIREDAGPSTIVSVRRFGWPLKVVVLVDNGPRTADALVHYRTGLMRFVAGLPPAIPVSLIATAPNPRWLIRETTDRVRIERGINLITTDEGLGRFSDALIEYASRLDDEFRRVSSEQLPPYLPVLVSIATTHQDGSLVQRDANLRMITSLRRHRVWTNMIMISPSRSLTQPGGLPAIESDEGQNAEIAKTVQEFTRGRYVPITGSGTSALISTILPELAQQITLRYIRQMTQHRIVLDRPAGVSGPMKNFSLSLLNHPGAQIRVSTDGSMP